ncbi:MAG: cobalamin biosynthesis protein [Candidatus Hydrothermarchaeales archaeon]
MTPLFQILLLALLADWLVGEPRRFHSTVWMGRLTSLLRPYTSDRRIYGVLILLAVALPFSFTAYALVAVTNVVVAAWILKLQFAWRSLSEHAKEVSKCIQNDLERARKAVSKMVGRDTGTLDEGHVISAAVESIGDSSVDGIVAPLFYYLVVGSILGPALGVAAAVFYRAVNTLDSELGYKKKGYSNIGFFPAKLDDVLNYIPARITSLLILLSSILLGENWKGSAKIFLRDRKKTLSPNSGHAMSALAGALGVQLEKIGYYRLGDGNAELRREHIGRALRLVNISSVLFLVSSIILMS